MQHNNKVQNYDHLILEACRKNQIDLLKQILDVAQEQSLEKSIQQSINTSYSRENGYYSLHWAITNKNAELAQLLLANGANPNLTINGVFNGRHKLSNIPLMIAIENGLTTVALSIVNHLQFKSQPELLEQVILKYRFNTANPLVESAINKMTDFSEIILEGCRYNNLAFVEYVMGKVDSNHTLEHINKCYLKSYGYNCLHNAIRYDNIKLVTLLLNNGADPNILPLEKKDLSSTPLMMALERDDTSLDLVRKILMHPNFKPQKGLIELFMKKCSLDHLTDEDLIQLSLNKHFILQKELFARIICRLNFDITNPHVVRSLKALPSVTYSEMILNACEFNQLGFVEEVLKIDPKAINLNTLCLNSNGYSSLQIAIHHRNAELAKLLLQHGADPNMFDKSRRGISDSPLVMAIENHLVTVVSAILTHPEFIMNKWNFFDILTIHTENINLESAKVILAHFDESQYFEKFILNMCKISYSETISIVKLAIEMAVKKKIKINLNKQRSMVNNYAALHIAISKRNLGLARLLWSEGADPNIVPISNSNMDNFQRGSQTTHLSKHPIMMLLDKVGDDGNFSVLALDMLDDPQLKLSEHFIESILVKACYCDLYSVVYKILQHAKNYEYQITLNVMETDLDAKDKENKLYNAAQWALKKENLAIFKLLAKAMNTDLVKYVLQVLAMDDIPNKSFLLEDETILFGLLEKKNIFFKEIAEKLFGMSVKTFIASKKLFELKPEKETVIEITEQEFSAAKYEKFSLALIKSLLYPDEDADLRLQAYSCLYLLNKEPTDLPLTELNNLSIETIAQRYPNEFAATISKGKIVDDLYAIWENNVKPGLLTPNRYQQTLREKWHSCIKQLTLSDRALLLAYHCELQDQYDLESLQLVLPVKYKHLAKHEVIKEIETAYNSKFRKASPLKVKILYSRELSSLNWLNIFFTLKAYDVVNKMISVMNEESAEDCYQIGLYYLKSEQYLKSLVYLAKAAMQNHDQAQATLLNLYRNKNNPQWNIAGRAQLKVVVTQHMHDIKLATHLMQKNPQRGLEFLDIAIKNNIEAAKKYYCELLCQSELKIWDNPLFKLKEVIDNPLSPLYQMTCDALEAASIKTNHSAWLATECAIFLLKKYRTNKITTNPDKIVQAFKLCYAAAKEKFPTAIDLLVDEFEPDAIVVSADLKIGTAEILMAYAYSKKSHMQAVYYLMSVLGIDIKQADAKAKPPLINELISDDAYEQAVNLLIKLTEKNPATKNDYSCCNCARIVLGIYFYGCKDYKKAAFYGLNDIRPTVRLPVEFLNQQRMLFTQPSVRGRVNDANLLDFILVNSEYIAANENIFSELVFFELCKLRIHENWLIDLANKKATMTEREVENSLNELKQYFLPNILIALTVAAASYGNSRQIGYLYTILSAKVIYDKFTADELVKIAVASNYLNFYADFISNNATHQQTLLATSHQCFIQLCDKDVEKENKIQALATLNQYSMIGSSDAAFLLGCYFAIQRDSNAEKFFDLAMKNEHMLAGDYCCLQKIGALNTKLDQLWSEVELANLTSFADKALLYLQKYQENKPEISGIPLFIATDLASEKLLSNLFLYLGANKNVSPEKMITTINQSISELKPSTMPPLYGYLIKQAIKELAARNQPSLVQTIIPK